MYRFELNVKNHTLEQRGFTTSEHFTGPRHLTLSANGKFLYLLNQKGSSVVVFRRGGDGELEELQSISTLPADYDGPQNHSAEILIHPNGKWLYVSNRVHDSLVCFRIESSGKLAKVQSVSSGGQNPWSFVFDSTGKYLICSNLKSHSLGVFKIDQATGALQQLERKVTIPEPISLAILSRDE